MPMTHYRNPHGGDSSALARELGLGHVPDIRLDFSVNVNPLGPPDWLQATITSSASLVSQYPPVYAKDAAEALAHAHGVRPESIIVGNGSTEIFSWLVQTLQPTKPIWLAPCYVGYGEICLAAAISGAPLVSASQSDRFQISLQHAHESDADMIFIGSPNNPTGVLTDPDAILHLASSKPECHIVIDESFMDFCSERIAHTQVRDDLPPNLIVVKSLTKFFAIPGIRLGMACASPETIRIIERARLPWSVNWLAQRVATSLYEDTEYIARTHAATKECREDLVRAFSKLDGYEIYPSCANFVLVKLPDGTRATPLQAQLLKEGILIRSCANFTGLGEHFCRLAVRPTNETEQLVEAIMRYEGHASAIPPAKRVNGESTPAIMVVGTASNSGKSVVVSALCRHFWGKGVNVAPFKAQNMSLNSFVTDEGGEMGRAQVVQARAAGALPHTDMNPVLLKPMGESGSQVIVDGQPIGTFPARDYYAMKNRIRQSALDAYDRLAGERDLVILEGAGSPAEINLQKEDFVNMAMAEHAQASVILVADIDRGGVFASIMGTVSLMPERHRKLIKGILINKFRGDVSLLDSGIHQIESLTGIPVLGVLPYVRDLRIEDEDSLGLDDRDTNKEAVLDIAVARLPRISNYTDFLPFECISSVSVRYVARSAALGTPDLVIIPGTRNTRGDLDFLRKTGLADAILALAERQTPVFGICGGYQMLGTRISDEEGIEGEPGSDKGMGLLPVSTVLAPTKELAQVSGKTTTALPFAPAGTPFHGYEIHAGCTTVDTAARPLAIHMRRKAKVSEYDGAASKDGTVFGCYIHGLFDSALLRRHLLQWLCERKGVAPIPDDDDHNETCDEIDRFTDIFFDHVDAKHISRLVTI